MLLLTGATGGLGSLTLHHLITTCHVDPQEIIVTTRHAKDLKSAPENVQSLITLGVQIRYADFSVPSSLRDAFKGATRLLLTSTPTMDDQLRLRQHFAAIDAAISVGVKHIYYTSLAFGGMSHVSVALVMRAHLLTESYLAERALKHPDFHYTAIREGIYAEAYPLFLGYFIPDEYLKAKTYDKLHYLLQTPGNQNGKIAWTAREDLGEANAEILAADPAKYQDQIVLLTSQEAFSLAETAAIVSKVANGPPIRIDYVETTDDFVEKNQNGAGFGSYRGPAGTRAWATTYDAIARGECEASSSTLSDLLERKPIPFDEKLKRMLAS